MRHEQWEQLALLCRQSMRQPLANEDHAEMFDMWFSRCLGVLHFTAHRVLGGPEGADLAVGNCWDMASRNTPSFASEGAFRSWLLRVLIDEALVIRRQVDSSEMHGTRHDPETNLSGELKNNNTEGRSK